jgi:predicted HAD superfamily Cof-like phosphohydrolase
MRDWQADVTEFHKKFGLPVGRKPRIPDKQVKNLRRSLIAEEAKEIFRAIENDDLAGVADGVADLIYVALGTTISYGIDLHPIWEAVQEANMSKIGGGKRHDGKIMKPSRWQAPDVDKLIGEQQHDDHS